MSICAAGANTRMSGCKDAPFSAMRLFNVHTFGSSPGLCLSPEPRASLAKCARGLSEREMWFCASSPLVESYIHTWQKCVDWSNVASKEYDESIPVRGNVCQVANTRDGANTDVELLLDIVTRATS